MNYAGFWQRFFALLIDVILLGVLTAIISFILRIILGADTNVISTVIQLVMSIAYWVFYQEKYGQTLGKKALGIKVVDASGKTPSAMTFFLREIIGKFISGIVLGLGYFWMLWDARKQTWHDKIASTYVIKV